jgi:hypothetical protein
MWEFIKTLDTLRILALLSVFVATASGVLLGMALGKRRRRVPRVSEDAAEKPQESVGAKIERVGGDVAPRDGMRDTREQERPSRNGASRRRNKKIIVRE